MIWNYILEAIRCSSAAFAFPDCFLFRTVRLQRPGISLWLIARPKIIRHLNQKKWWTRQTTYWSHIYQIKNQNWFLAVASGFWLTYPFSSIDVPIVWSLCIWKWDSRKPSGSISLASYLPYDVVMPSCYLRVTFGCPAGEQFTSSCDLRVKCWRHTMSTRWLHEGIT